MLKYKPAGSKDQDNVSREKWGRGQRRQEVTRFFDCQLAMTTSIKMMVTMKTRMMISSNISAVTGFVIVDMHTFHTGTVIIGICTILSSLQ